LDKLQKIIELRKTYTADKYTSKLTQEMLLNLYEFINSPMVERKNWFSDYDKACLLMAIELLAKKGAVKIDTQAEKGERFK
jgi:hypothetical protein